MTTTASLMKRKRNETHCAHLTPCGGACSLTDLPHMIHGCAGPYCDACHGGKTHADAMLARRRAAEARAAKAAKAATQDSMEGYDG